MEIVALFNNIRGYEGILPLLKKLSSKHKINLIYTPLLVDPSWSSRPSFDFPLVDTIPIENKNPSPQLIGKILERTAPTFKQAKVVFFTDIQNTPGADLYSSIKKINPNAKIIGLQHGLYQFWTRPYKQKIFDFYFAYGPMSLRFVPTRLHSRVINCGIPKLDALKGHKDGGKRYILFIGQKFPSPKILNPFLKELEEHYKLPVLVRNHPQFPDRYRVDTSRSIDVPEDLWEQISEATFVVTTHSTTLVEALIMRKRVVLLPNHGLSFLSGFKPISKDFTVEEFDIALEKANKWDCRPWLKEYISTLNFDSVERAELATLAIGGYLKKGYLLLYLRSNLPYFQKAVSLFYLVVKKLLYKLNS